MKIRIKNWSIGFALALISISAVSQTTSARRWTPARGYWVVEQNTHDRFHHIVRFYDDDHELVYTETLSNVKLNVDKNKAKLKLKKALEVSLVQWEKKRAPESNKGYVVAVLK